MLADVVSVARPGSSDGGSVPQLTVIVLSPPFGLLLLELLPPQDAARNARETRSTAEPKPRPSFRAPILFIRSLHLSWEIALSNRCTHHGFPIRKSPIRNGSGFDE